MADKFKKDVPDNRTIVPGVWSDLMDDASVTFDIDEDTGEVRVNIKNLDEIGKLLESAAMRIVDQNSVIIKQLCLIGAILEEMGNTGINLSDIEE